MIPFELEEDIYYLLGDHIYNLVQPEVSGDLDMFKYILGKIFLEHFSLIEPGWIDF